MLDSVLHIAVLVLFPPLLLGIINRTKALFAGRRGAPIVQPYRDLARLLRKGAVYSRTTTWVFRAGPMIALASAIVAGLILPLVTPRAPLGFAGDVIAFAYVLALGRFFTMAAALDTGSAFEGMGASREAAYSALAEPALFLALAVLCVPAAAASFSTALPASAHGLPHPALLAAAGALAVVLLAENSRMPVDDPNTHLELTMIHEVMVLDHGGPDLAFVVYGSAVKLFVTAALLLHVLVPVPAGGGAVGLALLLAGEVLVGVLVGAVESTMARLRLQRVPQLLIAASVFGAVGLAVQIFQGRP
jgi:formate hydrogenlyase subunit 4